jgi:hypothetical protein
MERGHLFQQAFRRIDLLPEARRLAFCQGHSDGVEAERD